MQSLAAKSKLDEHCSNYARKAVGQYKSNIWAKCNYTDIRWSNDEKGQRRWCLTVSEEVSDKELEVRKELLQQCYKRKASFMDPDNRIDIPTSCKDLKKVYLPIHYIYSRSTYNGNPYLYSPLFTEGGYIHHDFNQDGIKDYIFMERGKSTPILLSMCISDSNKLSWKREQLIVLTDEQQITPEFSVEYDSVRITDSGDLSIETGSHEHNVGYTYFGSIFRYDSKKKGFYKIFSTSRMGGSNGMPFEETEENYLTGWKTIQTDCSWIQPSLSDPNFPCVNNTKRVKIKGDLEKKRYRLGGE